MKLEKTKEAIIHYLSTFLEKIDSFDSLEIRETEDSQNKKWFCVIISETVEQK